MSNLNVLPPPLVKPGSATTSSNPLNVVISRFSSTNAVNSYSLGTKLAKLIKTQKKLLKQQEDLLREFNLWASTIPNENTRKLIIDFIKCLETEMECTQNLIEKKEALKLQISNVYKREQKCQETKLKRDKTSAKLKAAESKVGHSSSITLMKETIEELDCSLEIVDNQYIRAIEGPLRTGFLEVLISFQNISSKYKSATGSFFEVHCRYDRNSLSSAALPNNFRKFMMMSPHSRISQDMSTPQSFPISTGNSSTPTPIGFANAHNAYYNVYSPQTAPQSRADSRPLSNNARNDSSPRIKQYKSLTGNIIGNHNENDMRLGGRQGSVVTTNIPANANNNNSSNNNSDGNNNSNSNNNNNSGHQHSFDNYINGNNDKPPLGPYNGNDQGDNVDDDNAGDNDDNMNKSSNVDDTRPNSFAANMGPIDLIQRPGSVAMNQEWT